jgi:hypothetical protein
MDWKPATRRVSQYKTKFSQAFQDMLRQYMDCVISQVEHRLRFETIDFYVLRWNAASVSSREIAYAVIISMNRQTDTDFSILKLYN